MRLTTSATDGSHGKINIARGTEAASETNKSKSRQTIRELVYGGCGHRLDPRPTLSSTSGRHMGYLLLLPKKLLLLDETCREFD